MRDFIQWGGAWFYSGWGGMHGFIRGACMVLFGGRAWFYSGGVRGFIRGGVRGFIWGGMRGFIQGGVRGFIQGGVRGFIRGGVRGFFSFFGYNEIRSMSGRYASYWNAFLFLYFPHEAMMIDIYCSEVEDLAGGEPLQFAGWSPAGNSLVKKINSQHC